MPPSRAASALPVHRTLCASRCVAAEFYRLIQAVLAGLPALLAQSVLLTAHHDQKADQEGRSFLSAEPACHLCSPSANMRRQLSHHRSRPRLVHDLHMIRSSPCPGSSNAAYVNRATKTFCVRTFKPWQVYESYYIGEQQACQAG